MSGKDWMVVIVVFLFCASMCWMQHKEYEIRNKEAAALSLNDTLISRYSAYYKKTTGKELRAKELRISKEEK